MWLSYPVVGLGRLLLWVSFLSAYGSNFLDEGQA